MSAEQNEVDVIEKMKHADSVIMSTSITSTSANSLMEKVLENRERRRQSLKSLRDEVRSRPSSSRSEASLEDLSTSSTYERKFSQVSTSSDSNRRRSTISSSRERVSITMESLRRMALDLDLDDSEEESQPFKVHHPSVPTTVPAEDPYEYAKSSELTSSTRDLMNKDEFDEQQHELNRRARTSITRRSTGDIIMENLRQLAAVGLCLIIIRLFD